MRARICIAAAVTLSSIALACEESTGADHEPSQALQEGERLFSQSCAGSHCHGSGGRGAAAPALRGVGRFDDAYLLNVIADGISRTRMPGFAASLSGEEIRSIAAFVNVLAAQAENAQEVKR